MCIIYDIIMRQHYYIKYQQKKQVASPKFKVQILWDAGRRKLCHISHTCLAAHHAKKFVDAIRIHPKVSPKYIESRSIYESVL